MIFLILQIILRCFTIPDVEISDEICLSENEFRLYEMINSERLRNGLEEAPLSRNLTQVAQLHAADLHENKPFSEVCNPHSWSDQGTWKACCYTSDHSNAECMWKKPSEITDYSGDGYEIVAFWLSGSDPSKEIDAEKAMDLWLESPSHSQVILNRKAFQQVEWNAVGIGIEGNYASVWFGMEKDNPSPPKTCNP